MTRIRSRMMVLANSSLETLFRG